MSAPFDLLGAIAADPNVAPAFRAAIQPQQPQRFNTYANWIVLSPRGDRLFVVYAQNEAQALERAFAAPGCTARLKDNSDPLDMELGRRADATWGKLD